MKLAARVEGIGAIGPGFTGWPQAREILLGGAWPEACATVPPAPERLPAAERRRVGRNVRVALAAGFEAVAASGRDARDCAAVFTSSSSDGDNCHVICEVLASADRQISPTRFHNSVHNAPGGYWGIATGSMKAADSLCAFDGSPTAGLLEAGARLAHRPDEPVILVAHDAPYPEPLNALRPLPDAIAFAFAMAGGPGGGTGVRLELTDEAPTTLTDPRLEALRHQLPSARLLPLLRLLARGEPGRVVLAYLDGLSLAVELGP